MSTLYVQVTHKYINLAHIGQLKEKGIISIVCLMETPLAPQEQYTIALLACMLYLAKPYYRYD
jgi:hypothetical protein